MRREDKIRKGKKREEKRREETRNEKRRGEKTTEEKGREEMVYFVSLFFSQREHFFSYSAIRTECSALACKQVSLRGQVSLHRLNED